MEEAPAMILAMDVHCQRCGLIICGSIRRMRGVYHVTAVVSTGTVVVRGNEDIDTGMVERFLEQFAHERHYGRRRRRHGGRMGVRVITDGGRPERPHMAPAHYGLPRPPYYANGHYPYPSAAYQYPHQQHWPAPPPHMPPPHYHQYGAGPRWSDGAGPSWSDHNDDSLCSIM